MTNPQDQPASKENPAPLRRKSITTACGIAVLIFILAFFGTVVYHYSRFESGGSFVCTVGETGTISEDWGEFDYRCLLVRNRFPFTLSVTVRECQITNDPQQPAYRVLAETHLAFSGKRSLYSGNFETTLTVAASNDGRCCVTDQPFSPTDLTPSFFDEIPLLDDEAASLPEIPPGEIANLNDALVLRFPGDQAGKVLIVTLTPKADYN